MFRGSPGQRLRVQYSGGWTRPGSLSPYVSALALVHVSTLKLHCDEYGNDSHIEASCVMNGSIATKKLLLGANDVSFESLLNLRLTPPKYTYLRLRQSKEKSSLLWILTTDVSFICCEPPSGCCYNLLPSALFVVDFDKQRLIKKEKLLFLLRKRFFFLQAN